MSVAEHEEEPLDDDFCEEHNRPRVCHLCLLEAAEARGERQREEGGHA